jgi:predicted nucleic acid-binding protein
MSDNRVAVVLDTNVFVAAYWAPASASARVIQACIDGSVGAIYTAESRRETLGVLRQIGIGKDYLRRLDGYWDRAELVKAARVDDVPIDDPEDRKFLEAAAAGSADFLVTNDDHLLSVGYLGRTEILTPGSLVRVLAL